MRLDNLIEGLQIARKYFDRCDLCHTAAEHDKFWIYSTDRPMSSEDAKRMFELGWDQDTNNADDSEENPQYNPEELWFCFT